MAKNDKMLVAFLVSVGVFSAAQAVQYVGTLTSKDKLTLSATAKSTGQNVLLCQGVTNVSGAQNDKA